jgi:hypothetical protein
VQGPLIQQPAFAGYGTVNKTPLQRRDIRTTSINGTRNYVTLSNPLLSSNTSQKLSFDKLLTSIDANFKYISPGFDFVQFDGDLLKIFYDYYKTPSFGQILQPSKK